MKKLTIILSLILLVGVFFAGYFYYEATRGFCWRETENKSVEKVRNLMLTLKNSETFTDADAGNFFGKFLDESADFKDGAKFMSALKKSLAQVLNGEDFEYLFTSAEVLATNSLAQTPSVRAYDVRVVCVLNNLSKANSSPIFLIFSVEPKSDSIRTDIYLNGTKLNALKN